MYICILSETVLNPLELELQVTVSCYLGARNPSGVLKEEPVFSITEPSLQPEVPQF